MGVALVCAYRTICARAVKRLDENQEVIISEKSLYQMDVRVLTGQVSLD